MNSLGSMRSNNFLVSKIFKLERKFCNLSICIAGEPEKQGTLIRQLQEQHYIQYMQQLQAAQREELIASENEEKETASEKNEAVGICILKVSHF